MKTFFPLFLAFLASASADIFTLKDGSKLNATLVESSADEYVLDVQITKSINEPRTIKRSEVAHIEKIDSVSVEFAELKELIPVPPFASLKTYEERNKKLNEFLAKHKLSSSGTQALELQKQLEKELAIVKEGGIKISEDQVITSDEYMADEFAINAQITFLKFKKAFNRRAFIPALRTYEILERDYFGTKAHREALPLVTRLNEAYSMILGRTLEQVEKSEKQRMMTIEALPDKDRVRAIEAEEARKASYAERWELEAQKNYTWFSVDVRDSGSLARTLSALKRQSNQLKITAQDLEEITDTGQLYAAGWKAAESKNKSTLEPIINQLDEIRIAESYLDKLVNRFDPALSEPQVEEDNLETSEEEAAEAEKEN